MKGKAGVDVGRLVGATGGELLGRVETVRGGWFGALALAEEVRACFREPTGRPPGSAPRRCTGIAG